MKELVRINLGEVFVESVYGEGCTFSFTVPSADPECIVDCLIKRTIDQRPDGEISVLRIEPKAQNSTGDLASFLVSICYPCDLIYECPHTQSTFVTGETSEPEGWVSRIERLANESRSKLEIKVHQVGVWPARNAREKLFNAMGIAMKEPQHV